MSNETHIFIELPAGYAPERQYVLNTVFNEFLGVSFSSIIKDTTRTQISIRDRERACLTIPDVLFASHPNDWISKNSLPKEMVRRASHPDWPSADALPPECYMLFPLDSDVTAVGSEDGDIHIKFDLLGAVFFMLTRMEECIFPERDRHNRFSATTSLGYQHGFLDAPVVDEYVDLLWLCLKRLGLEVSRKARQFCLKLSHDVDVPLASPTQSLINHARTCAADVVKRHDLGLFVKRSMTRLLPKRFAQQCDPCNTFRFIMRQAETHGIKSSFYFITDAPCGKKDCEYEIDDQWILRLIKEVGRRGHEVGLHPSYLSYQDREQTAFEFERLRQVADRCEIQQSAWGGRQHFLRWSNPQTWQNWEAAGLDYDSTLGFADAVGFRCGTCHPYPVYDLQQRRQLRLIEIPLIVMDWTIFQHLQLDEDTAFDTITTLADTCRRYEGTFTLLWHNNHLVTLKQRQFYSKLVRHLASVTAIPQ